MGVRWHDFKVQRTSEDAKGLVDLLLAKAVLRTPRIRLESSAVVILELGSFKKPALRNELIGVFEVGGRVERRIQRH